MADFPADGGTANEQHSNLLDLTSIPLRTLATLDEVALAHAIQRALEEPPREVVAGFNSGIWQDT